MSDELGPWYESDKPWRHGLGIGGWIAMTVAFFLLIGAAIWGAKVLFAPAKGAGDQELIIHDGRNRVNAQEWFAGQLGQIKAADQKLDMAADDMAANPDDRFAKTNYIGLKNRCIDMVNAYNSEANKISRGRWISPDLPQQINTSDPATDCLESK